MLGLLAPHDSIDDYVVASIKLRARSWMKKSGAGEELVMVYIYSLICWFASIK